MIGSPLRLEPVFSIGPVPITEPVLVTWAIMVLLGGFAALVTRRLALEPSKTQAVLETVVGAIDDQIRGTMQVDPTPYRALVGTIFLYLLSAN
jgi:F-type H+-transporting ATPase subunit a